MNEVILTGSRQDRLKYAQQSFEKLRRSDKTIRDYQKAIKNFIRFIDNKPLTQDTLIEYYSELEKHTEWSVSTKNKYLTAAKTLAQILYNTGQIPMDITKDISGKSIGSFKQSKRHKKNGVKNDDLKVIAERVRAMAHLSPRTQRDAAIFALLIFQGLRSIEVVRLDVEDIDFASNTILIWGKGRDDKELRHLLPTTAEVLERYLNSSNKRSGALFINGSSNSKGERLSTKSVNKMVKIFCLRIGFKYSPHQFRHTYTSKLIDAGIPLPIVMKQTGHKCLETLQNYYEELDEKKSIPRIEAAFSDIQM